MLTFIQWTFKWRYRNNSEYYKSNTMLIIGAKGFAKEILEVLHINDNLSNIAFYDDVNDYQIYKLYNQFDILKNSEEASLFFKTKSNPLSLNSLQNFSLSGDGLVGSYIFGWKQSSTVLLI